MCNKIKFSLRTTSTAIDKSFKKSVQEYFVQFLSFFKLISFGVTQTFVVEL